MNNVIEKAEQYHTQFQQARTDDERQALASDYKAYYAQLSADDKMEADNVHDAHFAEARQKIAEFDGMLQRANDMLRRHKQQTV